MQWKAAGCCFIHLVITEHRGRGEARGWAASLAVTWVLTEKLVSAGQQRCARTSFAAGAVGLVAHCPGTPNEGPGERAGLSGKATGPFLGVRANHS